MDMSWIETSLTRLEARLRALIEGDTDSRDGISRKLQHQLEHALIMAMRSGMNRLPGEGNPSSSNLMAPDQYTLVLPALQAQSLLTHSGAMDRLTHKLESTAKQVGIGFAAPPMLRVVADPLAKGMNVLVEFSHAGMGDSSTSLLEGGSDQASADRIPNAFLIVNGLTTFPLTEPVINIGRDPSNQLHLDDMRVSRMHAQLRFVQGRFVIFDLDSKGGTFVNGVAVSTHALSPGDVIMLAGVPLVYGQEAATQAGYTQELPIDPPTPEVL
jgi:hypothetical protein